VVCGRRALGPARLRFNRGGPGESIAPAGRFAAARDAACAASARRLPAEGFGVAAAGFGAAARWYHSPDLRSPSKESTIPVDERHRTGLPAGLTEAEVTRRRAAGQGNDAPVATGRTYRQIVRDNVFNFINNLFYFLGILLLVLGKPLDAFAVVFVIAANTVISLFQ